MLNKKRKYKKYLINEKYTIKETKKAK